MSRRATKNLRRRIGGWLDRLWLGLKARDKRRRIETPMMRDTWEAGWHVIGQELSDEPALDDRCFSTYAENIREPTGWWTGEATAQSRSELATRNSWRFEPAATFDSGLTFK